jgi:hypothetical protein
MAALDKEMVDAEQQIQIKTEGSLCQFSQPRILTFHS